MLLSLIPDSGVASSGGNRGYQSLAEIQRLQDQLTAAGTQFAVQQDAVVNAHCRARELQNTLREDGYKESILTRQVERIISNRKEQPQNPISIKPQQYGSCARKNDCFGGEC